MPPPAPRARTLRRRPLQEWALDVWTLVPVVLLGLPLLTAAGHPFARDLVFTPHLPLRPETLGLGTASPRAAPLDAVVGVLSLALDGAVLGRVAVLGTLALAGWGSHRLLRGRPPVARAVVAAFAVWNPFVVERLGLGQWALLLGYAVLPWVVLAVRDRAAAPAGRVAPWLALGALTPTSALLAGVTAVVLGVGRGRGDAERVRLVAVAAVAQLPWLVPALLGPAAGTSDPAGVAAFAARAERPGPAYLTLLGLGGIWDGLSVPGTREGWLGSVTAAVVVVALVVAALTPARREAGGAGWALGLGSLLAAGATTLPGVADLVARGSAAVPGLGLLRDGQKLLAPFVVLGAWALGVAVATGLDAVRSRLPDAVPGLAALGLALPFVLLPDATVVVHRVLTPAAYPADYAAVARAVDGRPGVLASAPWRLYRRYPWASDYPTYDPASRWFDVRVVTTDTLSVGTTDVAGEDSYAARVGAALARPGPEAVRELAALGVRWVLVSRADPDAGALLDRLTSATGVERLVDGPDLVLLGLPGAAAAPAVGPGLVAAVAATDLGVLALLVGAGAVSRRRRRQDGPRSVTVA